MLKNYFKIAWRNMVRNKAFSTINILGLALGMAGSILIFLWIQDERRVDAWHQNSSRLYNVMGNQLFDGKIETSDHTQGILAEELKKQFPEIVHAASYAIWLASTPMTFSAGDKIGKETGTWASADWFRMFSIPLLAGTPATALNSPNSLAISRKVAENYFESADKALGKSIRVDGKKVYQVTAVFENLPSASSRKYDFLLNWYDYLEGHPNHKSWWNYGPETIIQLRPDADVALLQRKLLHFIDKYAKTPTFSMELFLQKHSDAYLYSNFRNGQQSGGRIEYVRLFAVIAIFLLFIACINFMNLSTARSAKRAREVGVRKVVGAMRGWLAGQFMGEALLFTVMALLTALVIVILLLPAFNTLTDKSIRLSFSNGLLWLVLPGIALITALMAGSYPTLFLSSLNPLRVLKGTLKFGAGARIFRQGLVVFQFVLSMLLITGTLIVFRQINFIQSKNLGYDRESLLYVPLEGEAAAKFTTFKQELLRTPAIRSVSVMEEAPTSVTSSTYGVTWPGKDPNVTIDMGYAPVGYDFTQTLGIPVSGRDFSPAFGADSINYLINESAAARMGFKEPVGQTITMWGRKGQIVGVMKDFHFESLHTAIKPMILWLNANPANNSRVPNMLVRTKAGEARQAIADIEKLWRAVNPAFPFTYTFADQEYQKLYKSETIIASLANYFAIVAIFISCLGLLGLSAFTAEQRTKEIGVRKVLGASVQSVIMLLSKDFLKLVLIAIILASPLAWYAMNQWLANFAYHIDVEWWVFVLAGVLAIGIALLTVSFQSVKAALMNPIQSLRTE